MRLLKKIVVFQWILLVTAAMLHAAEATPIEWKETKPFWTGVWSRAIDLGQGQWLGICTIPAKTNTSLQILTSADRMRSWSPVTTIATNRVLDNGELIQLPDASLLLTCRSLIEGQSYWLPVYRSIDGGRNWTWLSLIDKSENLGKRGLWEPDFILLSSNTLAVTYSNEKHDHYSQVISERISTNNGVTWSEESIIVSEKGSTRPGMSQMARMTDGRYILVYEVCGIGNCDVHYKISDDGIHWPSGLGSRIPCQQCGPYIISIPDGRLFVSSCANQISFSEDFGKTWRKANTRPFDLKRSFSWPAIYQTDQNELALQVSRHGIQTRFGQIMPRSQSSQSATDFHTKNLSEWTLYGGEMTQTNDILHLNNTNRHGAALIGNPIQSDGLLECDIQSAGEGDAGLLFRITNPDDVSPNAMHGYYAGFVSTGEIVLARLHDGWTELARASLSSSSDQWHHMRITLKGPDIQIFVDHATTPQIRSSDAFEPCGQIGLRANQATANFKNIHFTPTFNGQ